MVIWYWPKAMNRPTWNCMPADEAAEAARAELVGVALEGARELAGDGFTTWMMP